VPLMFYIKLIMPFVTFIANLIGAVLTPAIQLFSSVAESVFGIMDTLMNSFGGVFAPLLDGVKNTVSTVLNWVTDMINVWLGAINYVIKLVGGKEIKLMDRVNLDKMMAQNTVTNNTSNSKSNSYNINNSFDFSGGSKTDSQTAIQKSADTIFQVQLKKLVMSSGY